MAASLIIAFSCAALDQEHAVSTVLLRRAGKPFAAKILDRQLDDAEWRFLHDRRKNRMEGETLYLSSIFKWHGDDFARAAGSPGAYLARSGLRDSRIEFLDYDWSLNGTSGAAR